jgi:hypothetical protein
MAARMRPNDAAVADEKRKTNAWKRAAGPVDTSAFDGMMNGLNMRSKDDGTLGRRGGWCVTCGARAGHVAYIQTVPLAYSQLRGSKRIGFRKPVQSLDGVSKGRCSQEWRKRFVQRLQHG